jgi:hypothetical protein
MGRSDRCRRDPAADRSGGQERPVVEEEGNNGYGFSDEEFIGGGSYGVRLGLRQ